MKLADYLVREAIVTDLLATTKEEAIREIVRSLQNAGYVAGVDTETLVKSFLEREELGSTAIGKAWPAHMGATRQSIAYLGPSPSRDAELSSIDRRQTSARDRTSLSRSRSVSGKKVKPGDPGDIYSDPRESASTCRTTVCSPACVSAETREAVFRLIVDCDGIEACISKAESLG